MTNDEYYAVIERKVTSLLSYCLDMDIEIIASYEEKNARNASGIYTFKINDYRCSFSFNFGIIDDINSIDDISSILHTCSLSLKSKPEQCKKSISNTYTITGSTFTSFNESITKAMKSYEDDVRRAVYEAGKNGQSDEVLEKESNRDIESTHASDKLDNIITILNDIKRLLQTM